MEKRRKKLTEYQVIRKRAQIHCARGPKWCTKCQEMAREKKYCLIELFPEPGNVARPIDEFTIEGRKQMCEFDIIKVFNSEKEAKEYAEANSIKIE